MKKLNLSNTCQSCGNDVRLSHEPVVLKGEMLFCNTFCLETHDQKERIKYMILDTYNKHHIES